MIVLHFNPSIPVAGKPCTICVEWDPVDPGATADLDCQYEPAAGSWTSERTCPAFGLDCFTVAIPEGATALTITSDALAEPVSRLISA